MKQNSNPKFLTFECALLACQALLFHFARLGFLVTLTASKESSTVYCVVFHDDDFDIEPSEVYIYSSKCKGKNGADCWTTFNFLFDC